jgi:integrase
MRGNGRVFRPKVRGRETAVWWIDYSLHGQRYRESAHTTVKREAQQLLRTKLTEREAGRVIGRPERVVFAEYRTGDDGKEELVGGLRALGERQYALDGRRSLTRLRQAFTHLEAFLGRDARALEITAARLDRYAVERLAEGAARSTVNYELACLRRAFRLGIEKGLLASTPAIKLPRVRNTRSGFFEDGDFAALLLELPADLQSVVRFLRLTGWRRSEVLGLTWDQVDWEGQVIRLAAVDTKGNEARLFPFGLAPELIQLLEAQWKAREGLFVFHSRGKPIGVGALRSGWKRATKRAGLKGRLVHDLRRSAARDLRRAGVSEGEIMKLCGWRTRSMFDRYNIIDEQDLARAVAKRFGKAPAHIGTPTEPANPLSSSRS